MNIYSERDGLLIKRLTKYLFDDHVQLTGLLYHTKKIDMHDTRSGAWVIYDTYDHIETIVKKLEKRDKTSLVYFADTCEALDELPYIHFTQNTKLSAIHAQFMRIPHPKDYTKVLIGVCIMPPNFTPTMIDAPPFVYILRYSVLTPTRTKYVVDFYGGMTKLGIDPACCMHPDTYDMYTQTYHDITLYERTKTLNECIAHMFLSAHKYMCLACKKKHTNNRCASCKVAYYCSKTCQRNDFPVHRKLCAKYKLFGELLVYTANFTSFTDSVRYFDDIIAITDTYAKNNK